MPTDLRIGLTHEGQKTWLREAYAVRPCWDSHEPSGAGRTARALVRSEGRETGTAGGGLVVFADVASAKAYLASVRTVVRDCPPDAPGLTQDLRAVRGAWDEGLLFRTVPNPSYDGVPKDRPAVLVRVGRAVATYAFTDGDNGTSVSAEAERTLRGGVREIVPRMCVYTADSC